VRYTSVRVQSFPPFISPPRVMEVYFVGFEVTKAVRKVRE